MKGSRSAPWLGCWAYILRTVSSNILKGDSKSGTGVLGCLLKYGIKSFSDTGSLGSWIVLLGRFDGVMTETDRLWKRIVRDQYS